MKLHYYPETDSLYIDLNEKPSTDSREVVDGVVVNLDADGNIVGIDIEQASKKLSLGCSKLSRCLRIRSRLADSRATSSYG